jgi:hypothetical protein
MYKMGGGLMQLVAYGAQDIYLTGNPQITFFKVVYRRHTNFSMETIQQTINGSSVLPAAGATSNGTVTVSRNGDLLGALYVHLPSFDGTAANRAVNEVRLEIGGQEIDRQTEEWMELWSELSTSEAKATGLKAMQGAVGTGSSTGVNEAMVPLHFWFCRNAGLYLPLIALQYHEVKVKCTWSNTGAAAGTAGNTIEMWADYVYLDTDERRRFAQVSHEYLIEQVQIQTEGAGNTSFKLNFNHPVKALYWTDANSFGSNTAKLTLNGHDRFAEQTKEFFQLRQPYQCHTAVPRQNLPAASIPLVHQRVITSAFEAQSAGVLTVAVTSGDVMVTQDTGAAGAFGNQSSFLNTEAPTAATTVYSFLKSDLQYLPVVGDVLRVTYDGTQSSTGSATVQKTVFATVTAVTDGALNTVNNASNYHIKLDASILLATLTADLDDADTFTIESLELVKLSSNKARTSNMTNNINMYSFALKPEEHQPSGTCNFSRIDTAHLKFSGSVTVAKIYALNYNVLRIMSGMGGLAYSN